MAGPHGGNSQGPSFHDPLLIRTGLATKSRVHSHKNMILQRGNLAGLEGVCGGKFLYGFSFFFLQFFFISLRCKIFCDSGFLCFFCFLFLYKTLALKDSNTIQTMATNPTPGAPAGLGALGAPFGSFVAVFLASGARGQVRGPGADGICTAVPWGDGHRKDT